MISTFGMATGVFLTGILLLRICDPNFESPVLANYSLSYTIISISYFALLNVILTILLTSGLFAGMSFTLILGIVSTIAAIVSSKILFKNN
jgi:possible ESS family glutamate:sodium (Na+) symporter